MKTKLDCFYNKKYFLTSLVLVGILVNVWGWIDSSTK